MTKRGRELRRAAWREFAWLLLSVFLTGICFGSANLWGLLLCSIAVGFQVAWLMIARAKIVEHRRLTAAASIRDRFGWCWPHE